MKVRVPEQYIICLEMSFSFPVKGVRNIVMCLRPKGGGHIVFGADPIGVHVQVASFLCVIFLTSRWILTKLALIHCWEGGKSWLDDLTVALWNVQNRVSMRYLWNQWMDFYQTCTDTLLGVVGKSDYILVSLAEISRSPSYKALSVPVVEF